LVLSQLKKEEVPTTSVEESRTRQKHILIFQSPNLKQLVSYTFHFSDTCYIG